MQFMPALVCFLVSSGVLGSMEKAHPFSAAIQIRYLLVNARGVGGQGSPPTLVHTLRIHSTESTWNQYSGSRQAQAHHFLKLMGQMENHTYYGKSLPLGCSSVVWRDQECHARVLWGGLVHL